MNNIYILTKKDYERYKKYDDMSNIYMEENEVVKSLDITNNQLWGIILGDQLYNSVFNTNLKTSIIKTYKNIKNDKTITLLPIDLVLKILILTENPNRKIFVNFLIKIYNNKYLKREKYEPSIEFDNLITGIDILVKSIGYPYGYNSNTGYFGIIDDKVIKLYELSDYIEI